MVQNVPVGQSKKIDNSKGIYMAVHVEHLYDTKNYKIYSLAHYYIQNGDMVPDPDMTFYVCENDMGTFVVPMSYQDSFGYQESVMMNKEGNISFHPKLQSQHNVFANKWIKNIKDQQGM